MRGKFLKNRKMQYIMSFIACILVVHCAGLVAKADGVDMEVVYRTYTAESGWLGLASQGGDCLADNKEALTGVKMFISKLETEAASTEAQTSVANVTYSVYSKEADWSEPVQDNSKASSGDNPIKAIRVQISGAATTNYNVEYRVLNTNNEWSKWCVNGEVAGNTYGEENLIGIQAKITQKVVETVDTNTNVSTGTSDTSGIVVDNSNESNTSNDANTSNTVNTGASTANGNDAMEAFIAKAVSQLGKGKDANGITVYGQWYQDNIDGSAKFNSAAWCAMFLSWCANDAGISRKTVGYYAACSYWKEQFFVPNGGWHDASGYTPARGDLIFFDYDGNGVTDHNGLVESVSATEVVAIEGNVDNKVQRCTYALNSTDILGYGKPDYSKNATNVEADKKEKAEVKTGSSSDGSTGSNAVATGQAQQIMKVAANEIGTKGKNGRWTPYGQWYADNIAKNKAFANTHWCAMFVSWCANQTGVSTSVIKPYASCAVGVTNFKGQGVWHSRSSGYQPKKGDVIFFTFSHTGLVDYVENGHVHTIEGNTSNSVRRRSYSLSYSSIQGYGSPKYN